MTTKQYAELAKKITGLDGKYVGQGNVKLEDGSKILLGETIALQTYGTGETVFYSLQNNEWKSKSIEWVENKEVHGGLLDDVYTFAEASQKWKLGESTLRSTVKSNRLVEGKDYKKSGKVWLITKEAMKKLYGERP